MVALKRSAIPSDNRNDRSPHRREPMPQATDGPPMQEADCPFCERPVLVYEDPPRCPLCACPLDHDRMRPFMFPPEQ